MNTEENKNNNRHLIVGLLFGSIIGMLILKFSPDVNAAIIIWFAISLLIGLIAYKRKWF